MKSINCDVIKDLLPSYIDKISSSSTNELIEEHLLKCNDCCLALKDMNKEIDIEAIYSQTKQIDYLKKYRKNKIITIIFAIILTIDILLAIPMALYFFHKNIDFLVDVNSINVSLSQKNNINGKQELIFEMIDSNRKYDLLGFNYEVVEDNQNKSVYVKVVGKLSWGTISRSYFHIEIDEYINHICIEDKKGKVKEIWNKNTGLLVKDISNIYSMITNY